MELVGVMVSLKVSANNSSANHYSVNHYLPLENYNIDHITQDQLEPIVQKELNKVLSNADELGFVPTRKYKDGAVEFVKKDSIMGYSFTPIPV